MNRSSLAMAANVEPPTNVGGSKLPLGPREAAERWQAVVLPLSAGQIAQAANVTKSAAKGWLDGSRCPSYYAAANMARVLGRAQELVFEDIGIDRAAHAGSVDVIVRQLYKIASGDNQEAWVARSVIEKLRRPDSSIQQDAVILYLTRSA